MEKSSKPPDLDLNVAYDLLEVYSVSGLSEDLKRDLIKSCEKKGNLSHLVKEFLTHEEQQTLIKNFPEYNLVFLNRLKHPHPYAAASRKLEYRILIDRLGLTSVSVTPEGYDDLVCDIGGEFSFHVMNGHDLVHSCNPVLDIRDAARHVTRREQLFRHTLNNDVKNYLNLERYNKILRIFKDPVFSDSVSCNLRAQDCCRTARYGICLHSSYDISLQDYAEIMIKKNMYEIHGTFIFSDIVMLEREGMISGIDAYYSIDSVEKTIEFSFRGDSSTCYKHNLDDYLALVTLNYFVHRASGTTFMIELGENRAGIQFFKIIRVDGSFPGSSLTRYIWMNSLEGKTKINFFDLDEKELARGNYKKAFPRVTFYVDTELVDKVVSHAYASTESKFRPIEIFNFLVAYNGRIFFGSDVCVRNKPLPVAQSMLLANAIYVYVFAKKYNLGKIDQYLLNSIKHDRDLAEGSLKDKWYKWKSTAPVHYGGGHGKNRLLRTILKPLHAFLFWFKKSRMESIKFLEENVKFERCSEIIKMCDYTIVDENTGRVFTHSVPAVSVLEDSKVLNVQKYVMTLLEKYVVTGRVYLSTDLLPERRFVEPVIDTSVDSRVALSNLRNYALSYRDNIDKIVDVFETFVPSTLKLVGDTICLDSELSLEIEGRCYYLGSDTQKKEGVIVVTTDRAKLLCDLLRMVVYLPIVNIVVGNFGLLTAEIVALVKVLRGHQFLYVPPFCSPDETSNYLLGYFERMVGNLFVLGGGEKTLDKFFKMFRVLCKKLPEGNVGNQIFEKVVISWPSKDNSIVSMEDSNIFVNSGVGSDMVRNEKQFDELSIVEKFVGDVCCERHVVEGEFVSDEGIDVSSVSGDSEYLDVGTENCDGEHVPVPQYDLNVVQDSKEISIVTSNVISEYRQGTVVHGKIDKQVVDYLRVFLAEVVTKKKYSVVKGRKGDRHEWLFAARNYSYANRVLEPVGEFSEFESVVRDVVRENNLGTPNACLLVRYPYGSDGLNLHADDEPVHEDQQVITFCIGAGANIVLADTNNRGNRTSFSVVDGEYYFFRNQEGFLHGVSDIVTDDKNVERWAFTFRRFKIKKETFETAVTDSVDPRVEKSVLDENVHSDVAIVAPSCDISNVDMFLDLVDEPSDDSGCDVGNGNPGSDNTALVDLGGQGHCLFLCLTGGDMDIAMKLREYIKANVPESAGVKFDEWYFSKEEVSNECEGSSYAGTATVVAFCVLFNSNVNIYSDGVLQFEYKEFKNPIYNLSVNFKGAHYTRFNPCVVTNLCRFNFPFSSIDLEFYFDIFIKTFKPDRSFIDKLLFRDNTLPNDFFFNPLANLCLERDCNCLHGIRDFVSSYKGSDSLVLLHRNLHGLEKILGFLSDKRVTVRFLLIPGMVEKGFFFLLLSFRCNYKPVDLNLCYQNNIKHMDLCENCKGNVVNTPPYYNLMYRTYFFCLKNDLVRTTNSLDNVDKIFRVVVKKSTNVVVDRGTFVEVPMKFKSKGLLSVDRNETKKVQQALDDYLFKCGGIISVGIEAHDIENISVLVDLFAAKVSCVFIREGDSVFSSVGVNFSPKFVSHVDDNSYVVNSMLEVREYYRSSVETIKAQLKPFHQQYLNLISSPKFNGGESSFNTKPDFAMIDMSTGTYLIPPKDSGGPYMYAFDGTSLVDISTACNVDRAKNNNKKSFGKSTKWLKPGVFQGIYSVSKETKLINSGQIYNFLSKYDLGNFSRGFSIELVEGVPGCGKTHYIVNNHEFSRSNTGTVVLTSSREAAFDLRKRVGKKYGVSVDDTMIRKRYRTVDSFLMHYATANYCIDTIWLDEGLMRHFGDVMWCAYVSGCSRIIIIGDRAQIPFICRLPGVTLRYHLPALHNETMNVKFLSVTHRCPVDVSVLLNRFGAYKNKVTSSSSVRRSVNVKYIRGLSDLGEGYKNFQFLTFTQGDKDTVAKRYGLGVKTVNEFQGNQAENIVLIRLMNKNIPIFDSESHQLVGLSRHTKNFLYATVCRDKFAEFLSGDITESELNDCSVVNEHEPDAVSNVSLLNISNLVRYVAPVDLVQRAVSKFKGGGLVLGKTTCKQHPLAVIVPRAAAMVDMLKQDRVIRNFVLDNGGSGVAPYRVSFDEVVLPEVEVPKTPPYYVSDCIATMQYSYDILAPGQSVPNFDYDAKLFDQDELYFSVKENFVLSRFEKHVKQNFDCLAPTLRTSCPSPVNSSIKQVLKAFYDRNGNVPELQGQADDKKMADLLFCNFVDTYVQDLPLFERFGSEHIEVNVDSIEDWLFTQTPDVKRKAFPDEINCIFMKELNRYSMILKTLPKPKLEHGAEYKFPSPQTIAHATKDINAVFCPIVKEIKKRLYSVLPYNVVIFSDMSMEDFESLLSVRLPAAHLKNFSYMLEQDFSKYDKSQNRVALMFEIKFLLALGFPPRLIPTWIFMHVYSRLMNKFSGFKASVFFQRKSGDPMTYLGNTVFLMAVFCSAGLESIRDKIRNGTMFALFSGDDLLAFLDEQLDTSFISAECAVRFNLESKILNFRTAYFCSKFLFMTPWGRWVMVPDVLKLLTKLGRRDLVNGRHVEEYRISCLDVGKHLGNSALYPLIDECLKDRYHLESYGSFGMLYSAMFNCFSDRKVFSRLYYIKDGANIDFERVFNKLNDF